MSTEKETRQEEPKTPPMTAVESVSDLEERLRKEQSELEKTAAISGREPGAEKGQFEDSAAKPPAAQKLASPPTGSTAGQAIFVAHGKNKKTLEQLKNILEQYKIPYKTASDDSKSKRPISAKTRNTLEECNSAIFIFAGDEEYKNKEGKTMWRTADHMLYELGAASYLYGDRIAILEEESLAPFENTAGMARIPFSDDTLESVSGDLIKKLVAFGIVKIST